jgi:hypothetical protein
VQKDVFLVRFEKLLETMNVNNESSDQLREKITPVICIGKDDFIREIG